MNPPIIRCSSGRTALERRGSRSGGGFSIHGWVAHATCRPQKPQATRTLILMIVYVMSMIISIVSQYQYWLLQRINTHVCSEPVANATQMKNLFLI